MAWAGSSPNRTRGRTWARIRAAVLVEEPLCRRCGTSPSVVCDHVRSLAEGGTDERGNLAGMCKPCHDEKTAEESARAQGRKFRPRASIGIDGWPKES